MKRSTVVLGSSMLLASALAAVVVLNGRAAVERGPMPQPDQVGHGWLDNIVAALTPAIDDCDDVRDWVQDHPGLFTARADWGGMELRMRELDALAANCAECAWEADLADHKLAARVKEGRSTMDFVFEARLKDAHSDAAGVMLPWKQGDTADDWRLLVANDTVPCVFALEEATGGIVPGMNLLLGFDTEERTADVEVLYRTRDAGWLRFTFDHAPVRELNERLPGELKYQRHERNA